MQLNDKYHRCPPPLSRLGTGTAREPAVSVSHKLVLVNDTAVFI